jgi:hypothetical protein
MQRWRLVMATAIVVGLGALAAVLIQNDPFPTTTTVVTTTTTTSPTTTATSQATTSTTTAEQRLAEVEAILQELWFGWFDAIYRKDADALWEVVATSQLRDNAVAAMDTMTFLEVPELLAIEIDLNILLDRIDCLVVDQVVDSTAFRGGVGLFETVSVLWPDPARGWRFATAWQNPGDLWLPDCDQVVREKTP